MKSGSNVAIIGSGASAIFALKHLLSKFREVAGLLKEIHVFERNSVLGTGMPYNRRTTDRDNLCNISSAEIPELQQSLVDWLALLDDSALAAHDIDRNEINEGETYSRLVLGEYFRSQFGGIVNELRQMGIAVMEHANSRVDDLIDSPDAGVVTIKSADSERVDVERVIIATGHEFQQDDQPDFGYFASPWPMQKLLPQEDSVYDFVVGTLGAFLSAYDVVASLSNRHGSFERDRSCDGCPAWLRGSGASSFRARAAANRLKLAVRC